MKNVLHDISKAMAALAKASRESLVQVHGARRAVSSGVSLGAKGHVAVAAHILERDEGIQVTSESDEQSAAEVVGVDTRTDIGLLRTELEGPRPDWADSDTVHSGQLAIVVAPMRVALASVYATDDEWVAPTGGRLDRYIEPDARRFPGISGSLLVDASGRAIGMNTAALARRRTVTVPAATIARVVEQLSEHGSVRRGYLGVSTYPVRLPNDGQDSGLMLLSVQPESPAAAAGLLLGDVLLTIDDRSVESPAALLACLDFERVGQEITARVLRAGSETTVTMRVGAPRDR